MSFDEGAFIKSTLNGENGGRTGRGTRLASLLRARGREPGEDTFFLDQKEDLRDNLDGVWLADSGISFTFSISFPFPFASVVPEPRKLAGPKERPRVLL
jgi:hypothetical protein